jgi:hypothetical protein
VNLRFHSTALAILDHFTIQQIAAVDRVLPTMEGSDPFGVAHSCDNPDGHETIKEAGGEIVCRHCSRIFWA